MSDLARSATFSIGQRRIGAGEPTFVIAEAGVNHNGDPALAHKLIEAAAAVGASAVKFQTFVADELVTADAPKAEYQKRAAPEGDNQLDMLRKLELPAEAWPELKADAEARGLVFLSTPFDLGSVAFLDALGVDAVKIGSGDVTNTLLLRAVARMNRPVILSSGMSTISEIARALEDLAGIEGRIAILHCVSAYPTPTAECNLAVIPLLAQLFPCPIGFSDHTLGSAASIGAVALGARVIEKHLTLDRGLPGPDHAASLEPDAFRRLVDDMREVELAIGTQIKRIQPSEANVRDVARRGLFATDDRSIGDIVDEGMLAARRPTVGLPPTAIDDLLGRRLARPLRRNQAITWDDVEPRRPN